MSMLIQEYDLSMIPGGVPVIVPVSKADVGRTLVFHLYDNAGAFTAPDSSTATICGIKPDAKGFDIDATISGSDVSVSLTDQMSVVAGDVYCEIRISDGTNNVGTANFILRVERGVLDDSTDLSASDYSAIENAMTSAVASASAAKELVSEAQAARDDAKAAQKDAEESKTSASGSASSAAADAKTASDAADSAKSSAQTAAGYAGAAEYSLGVDPNTGLFGVFRNTGVSTSTTTEG